jgi:hypothetical protein
MALFLSDFEDDNKGSSSMLTIWCALQSNNKKKRMKT